MAYLDENGLTRVFERVKDYVDSRPSSGPSTGGTTFTTDETLTMSPENVLSVSLPTVTLTKDEYDALSTEDKQKDILYVIERSTVTPANDLSIQEYDTDDGWHVRKYSDGYVEQVLKKTEKVSVSDWTKISDYLYSVGYPYFEAMKLPVELVEKYGEIYAISSCNWSVVVAHRGLSASNQKDPLTYVDGFALYRIGGEVTSILTCTLTVTITGRWK